MCVDPYNVPDYCFNVTDLSEPFRQFEFPCIFPSNKSHKSRKSIQNKNAFQ